jgi:hypothetical protein
VSGTTDQVARQTPPIEAWKLRQMIRLCDILDRVDQVLHEEGHQTLWPRNLDGQSQNQREMQEDLEAWATAIENDEWLVTKP